MISWFLSCALFTFLWSTRSLLYLSLNKSASVIMAAQVRRPAPYVILCSATLRNSNVLYWLVLEVKDTSESSNRKYKRFLNSLTSVSSLFSSEEKNSFICIVNSSFLFCLHSKIFLNSSSCLVCFLICFLCSDRSGNPNVFCSTDPLWLLTDFLTD